MRHFVSEKMIPALVLCTMLWTGLPVEAAIQCYECHGSKEDPDYRPVDSPYRNITTGGFQGNHRSHIARSPDFLACNKCHPGNATLNSSHRNGLIEVSANINASPKQALYRNMTSPFPQTPAPELGTCTSVNCHFERETPAWGSRQFAYPGDCDSCHGTPPSGGETGAAGSHPRHDSYYGGVNRCKTCHTDHTTFSHATSAGRNLVVTLHGPGGEAEGSYTGTLDNYLPSQSKTFGSCVNTYCHSDGTSVATAIPAAGTSAQWGSSLDCDGCHGNPPAYASGNPKANSHGRHGQTCNTCHTATTADGATIVHNGNHVNRAYTVEAGNGATFSYTFSPAGSSCIVTYCHSDGTALATGGAPATAATWGGDGFACNGCHGFPPAYANGSSKANSHQIRDHAQWRCNKCHAATSSDGYTITNQARHGNGAYDIASLNGGLFSAYSFDPSGGTCTNVGCHFNNDSRKWGTVLACDTCHDSPPRTASHLGHFGGTLADAAYGDTRIARDFGATAGSYLMNCGNCHPMDLNKHRNGKVEVELHDVSAPAGSLKKLNPPSASYTPGTNIFFDSRGFSYSKGTCSNIYCHSYNEWTTPVDCQVTSEATGRACDDYATANLVTTRRYKTATWEGTLPGDCSGCHANSLRSTWQNNDGSTGNSHSWVDPIYGMEQGHAAKWYNYTDAITCNVCHFDTVKSAGSWSRPEPDYFTVFSGVRVAGFSRHVNGTVDVAFDKTQPYPYGYYDLYGTRQMILMPMSSASYDANSKTCSNISCHKGQTSIKWGRPYRAYKSEWGIDYVCWECHTSGYY